MTRLTTTAPMATQNTRSTKEAAEKAVRTLIAYTGDAPQREGLPLRCSPTAHSPGMLGRVQPDRATCLEVP